MKKFSEFIACFNTTVPFPPLSGIPVYKRFCHPPGRGKGAPTGKGIKYVKQGPPLNKRAPAEQTVPTCVCPIVCRRSFILLPISSTLRETAIRRASRQSTIFFPFIVVVVDKAADVSRKRLNCGLLPRLGLLLITTRRE